MLSVFAMYDERTALDVDLDVRAGVCIICVCVLCIMWSYDAYA